MHAIADRPFLKWRDLFDVWWLRTQSKGHTGRGLTPPWEDEQFWHKAKVVNAMYHGTPEGLIPGLKKFVGIPSLQIVQAADKDLAPFLPPKLWERLKKDIVVEKIVQFVKDDVAAVVATISQSETNFKTKTPSDEFGVHY